MYKKVINLKYKTIISEPILKCLLGQKRVLAQRLKETTKHKFYYCKKLQTTTRTPARFVYVGGPWGSKAKILLSNYWRPTSKTLKSTNFKAHQLVKWVTSKNFLEVFSSIRLFFHLFGFGRKDPFYLLPFLYCIRTKGRGRKRQRKK